MNDHDCNMLKITRFNICHFEFQTFCVWSEKSINNFMNLSREWDQFISSGLTK